jgi:hypothetical protein
VFRRHRLQEKPGSGSERAPSARSRVTFSTSPMNSKKGHARFASAALDSFDLIGHAALALIRF